MTRASDMSQDDDIGWHLRYNGRVLFGRLRCSSYKVDVLFLFPLQGERKNKITTNATLSKLLLFRTTIHCFFLFLFCFVLFAFFFLKSSHVGNLQIVPAIFCGSGSCPKGSSFSWCTIRFSPMSTGGGRLGICSPSN